MTRTFRILWGVLVLLMASVSQAYHLTVYTTHEPPLNFTTAADLNDASGSDVQGFAVDVVREIMKRTDAHGSISIIPWTRSYQLLQTQPDVVLFSIARTPLREKLFQWVGPLSVSQSLLYLRQDAGVIVKTLDDARKLSGISVMAQDSKAQFLRSLGFSNLDQSFTWKDVYKKVHMGRTVALADTDLDFPILAREGGFAKDEVVPVYPLFTTQLYIGFSKSTSPDVVHRWQTALDEIKKDGTFQQLTNKWAGYWKVHWVVKNGALQPE
jgi:polar amino acid transport system substrate-binding protein